MQATGPAVNRAANTLIIGHRGAPSFAPENSMAGFETATRLGLDGVELDIHRASDGTLVVIHDAFLDRTTAASGRVSDRSGAELQKIRLKGPAGQRIPLLADVLDLFRRSSLELHFELKTDALGAPYPGMAEQTINELKRVGLLEQSVITSFVPEMLHEARAHAPQCKVLGSINKASVEMRGGLAEALKQWRALDGCYLALDKKLLSHALESPAIPFDLGHTGVWVVNDADELGRWLTHPLRQITTDRPELALLVRSMARAKK